MIPTMLATALAGMAPLAGRWPALLLGGVATACGVWLLRQTAGGANEMRVRRAVCWSLAALLVLSAVAGQMGRIHAGVWRLDESLPLHLCDLGVFLVALVLWGVGLQRSIEARWQRLFELAFVWGLGGTLQAVLTPDIDDHARTLDCTRYFILHVGIIVGVLLLTLGLRLRLERGAPGRVWIVTLALAVVVFGLNRLTGGNYMYLSGPPAHASLYDYFGPYPWSLLTLVFVGTGLIWLCYLPFWLTAHPANNSTRGVDGPGDQLASRNFSEATDDEMRPG
jgi:hypothetical integral membrane protein (TIGR02206 family)